MIMEAKKLCNLLSSRQGPRKASGVVQRPEWQRVHGVECSPVWRPENQDCRGRWSVPDLVHAGGRRSVPDGRASPRTHGGQTVSARPCTCGGQMVGASPRTCRWSGHLTSLPVVLCSGLTGLDDAHQHWRAFCFDESSNSHAGLFLSPLRHSQK